MPSIMAAMIPDEADGKIIRQRVCHLVAPSPKAASLKLFGTPVRASSEILIIVGSAINANSKLPVKPHIPVFKLKIFLRNGPSHTIPINPNTTLGIAARISISDFRKCFRCLGAISAMNIADITLAGTQIIIAPAVTYIEPRISGTMPNVGGSETGSQPLLNKNLPRGYMPNKERESLSRNKKIRKTKTMTSRPLSFMHDSIMYSLIFLR
jgi:hypothetical protein